jgi:hypothetical protein
MVPGFQFIGLWNFGVRFSKIGIIFLGKASWRVKNRICWEARRSYSFFPRACGAAEKGMQGKRKFDARLLRN